MSRFDDQLSRMQSLMNYRMMTNESEDRKGNIEFSKVASDGKSYAIIRECNKFYIKKAEGDKHNISEAYDYIGGFNNKKDYEYSSYQNALKNFDLKMMSINEAQGVKGNAVSLDPSKKQNFVIEGTDAMKRELARQRQIMENCTKIGCFEDPEGEKGNNNPDTPFEETAKVEGDKEGGKTGVGEKPEKQGFPFGNGGKAEAGKNVGSNVMSDGKAVAGEDPKGGKVVRVNESCCCDADYTFAQGLKGGEKSKTELNMPFSDTVNEEAEINPNDVTVGNGAEANSEEPINEEMEEWDEGLPASAGIGNPSETKKIVQEEDEDELEEPEIEGDDEELMDDEESSEEEPMDDAEEGSDDDFDFGTEDADEEFDSEEDEDFEEDDYVDEKLQELEDEIMMLKAELGLDEEPIEDETLDDEGIALDDDSMADEDGAEYEVDYEDDEDGDFEDAETEDEDFEDEGEFDSEDADEDFEDEDFEDEDEEELYENKKKSCRCHGGKCSCNEAKQRYMNSIVESVVKSIVKENNKKSRKLDEEATVLHDFGKHPGYRKKPMTLPATGSDNENGMRDWNDDSVHNEKPFGSSIGDGMPFNKKVVDMITDSIMETFKKKM